MKPIEGEVYKIGEKDIALVILKGVAIPRFIGNGDIREFKILEGIFYYDSKKKVIVSKDPLNIKESSVRISRDIYSKFSNLYSSLLSALNKKWWLN